ncbi:hypothetical protein [Caballeronia sp. LZ032]|uniref:hypothetical protein n=1 Tax=Caballeronia sp. LZ032 TaxID=3038565 RepID=UPI00285FA862|nr:hypothetical protein [Caballeronia sp. LZ032]MDR5880071.1 hypothetical protein [Caballeronia sp. LZ032]
MPLNASVRGIEIGTADGRGIPADRVVLAGGPWSAQLIAGERPALLERFSARRFA